MRNNLDENIKVIQALKPEAQAIGTVESKEDNSQTVDTIGYKDALIILNSGETSGSGTLAVKVQASDDNATWVDITSAAFTSVTAANDQTVYVGRLSCERHARYLNIHATAATAASDFAVTVILGNADNTSALSQAQTVAFSL